MLPKGRTPLITNEKNNAMNKYYPNYSLFPILCLYKYVSALRLMWKVAKSLLNTLLSRANRG